MLQRTSEIVRPLLEVDSEPEDSDSEVDPGMPSLVLSDLEDEQWSDCEEHECTDLEEENRQEQER